MSRIGKLRGAMERASIDGVLICDLANLRYFTGFYGGTAEDENMALIDQEHCVFLTDFRYTEQAENQCPGYEIMEHNPAERLKILDKLCREWGINRLWLEEEVLSLYQYRKLAGAMPDVLLMPNEGAIKSIRVIKEPEEIGAIRRAQEIAEKGLEHLLGYLKPGMTEREAALELEFYTRREGSDGMSFPTIIAAGPHGAMPHAQLSDRKIRDGDMIVMDFGCRCGGYCSDMTRTVVMGKATDEMRNVYELVKRAQQAALAGLKAGVSEVAGDRLAREIIDNAGYASQFGHGLGHGVGLEIHEAPRLSPLAKGVLEEGMVVTVEPGVYLPGKFGVRIEDFVVVKKDGIDNLIKAPKELIEL